MIPFLSSAKALLLLPIKRFIHADFHEIFQTMTFFDMLLFLIMHGVDKSEIKWHGLPVFLGLTYLAIRRHLHNKYSLLNVGKIPVGVGFDPADFPFRTPDGKFNDPSNKYVGSGVNREGCGVVVKAWEVHSA
ncbi:hypothetical protein L6452_10916 [Arctium lappa]|uniref:Uncharacterized protein n=1 Tax=Arctium lappa TaxID=4217 RepID=A0ACB9DNK6_ARCLA|nr:hypothetical protein L6452_10916 [Arctium lappa]